MNRPAVRVGQIWRLQGHRYRVVAVDDGGVTLHGIDVHREAWASIADGTIWHADWHFDAEAER